MDGYEQVCIVLVGYIGSAVQLHKRVVVAGIYYFYRGVIVLYHVTEPLGYGECDVLLVCLSVDGSWIVSSVSGIYDDCLELHNLSVLCK